MYRLWIISVLLNDDHDESVPRGFDINFVKNMSEEELVEVQEGIYFLDCIFSSLMNMLNGFRGKLSRQRT